MRKLLLAVALGSALSAHAADPKFDSFMGTVVGNSTTVTFGGNGQPIVTSANHLGSAPVHTVGNMGVVAPGGQPAYVGRADLPVAGTNKTAPVDVKVPINKRSAMRALVLSAKLAGRVGGGVIAGVAVDALLDYGLKNVQLAQDGSLQAEVDDPEAKYDVSDGFYWSASPNVAPSQGPNAACRAWWDASYQFLNMTVQSQTVVDYGPGAKQCVYEGLAYGWRQETVRFIITRGGNTSCIPGMFIVNGQCSDNKPYKVMNEKELLDAIASRDGWPSSATRALAEASADPRIEPVIETEKPNIIGPFKIQETPTVRTFAEPKPGAPGQTQSVTETKQKTIGLDYTDNKVKATTTETKQRVVDGVVEPEEKTEKDPENDLLVCGLPNTPACRIEEKGTPEPVEDTAQKDAERVHKPLDDLLKNPASVLPEFPKINWTFRLPSGCAPLSIPAFSPFLQSIDVCQFQPIFHDIMSMIWVGGALFGAIGTFWRNVFAKAG